MKQKLSETHKSKHTKRVLMQFLSLTHSEKNILRMIAEGLTSRQIAAELELSEKTVENHRGNICKKLGISGTSSLLRYAMQNKTEIA